MAKASAALAALIALSLSACGKPSEDAAYSRLHGDSGVEGKPYAEIISDLRSLQGRHAELSETFDYGTSEGGHTLTLMRIMDKTVPVAGRRPAALISEGIHGNEYLNITDRLPKAFLEGAGNAGYQEFLAKGGVVYLVPVLNPDGYEDGARENADGTDLNRSFPIRGANYRGIQASETKAIRDFVAQQVAEENVALEVSMEYHCCIGALIEPWAYKYEAPGADVQARNREVENALWAALGRSIEAGTVHEVLDYPLTNGGSDDYYLENYGRRAYSYEGRYGREAANFNGHLRWWNELLKLAGTGY